LGLLDSASEWKGKWITADLPRYDIEQSVLTNAFWINAGSTANQAVAVRLLLTLPPGDKIRSAGIDAAADGLISIYVNGHATRQGATSRTAPLHAEIISQLRPGTNIIVIHSAAVRTAIRRDQGQSGRNAIAAHGIIQLENGRRIEFNTDGTWKTALAPDIDSLTVKMDDPAWPGATVLAPYLAQPPKYCDNTIGPGRYLRKTFIAAKPITKARLYATALGVYETLINGKPVGDDLLAPGWTDYTKRVMVQTYDVTKLMQPGTNVVGAVLADGWYAGRLGWMGSAQYGTRPVFDGQLEFTHTDGSTEVVATDKSWKAGPGQIVGSDEQWGEIIDARAGANWAESSFDASAWKDPVVEEHSVALEPQCGPPVRRLLELAPQRIVHRGDAWVIDFGQNLVGHIRLQARGPAGTTVTVRHSEMLNADGSLYTENLRTALATDTFRLGGIGRETFEPHFTFHGFRYAEIRGYPGRLKPGDVRAIVVGSETPPTGNFECSNPDLNRLYQNIVWSQRGNFLSVPTDCPQRDERMGWMGDAQVFAPTAARNADVAAFFAKWMVDVDDGQGSNGDYSDVSPRVARPQPAMPVWGDAGIIIPWDMYTAYGDQAFLADNYPAMTRWLDFNLRRSHDLILNGGVGDHLAPERTPTEVVDTAYFANSAHLTARAAGILGYTNDAAKYDKLFHDITRAFNAAFVSTNGVIQGDTQTAYILALQFGLLPENLRAVAARRLAENVVQHGHLTTGFVGVGLICPTLTDIGRSDLAWQLVLTNSYPSWLFSVKNGATTIWERWDGWTPEQGFQDSAMNSFNHYSLGSVGAWLYSGAAGIRINEAHPGYQHFFLEPQFTSKLSHVQATFDSPYGTIASRWQMKQGRILYDITVPPNTSATLILPAAPSNNSTNRIPLVAGTYHFSLALDVLR
jgi:alpha-L-rhamnosidase